MTRITERGIDRDARRDVYDWRGRNVVDQEGTKVGTLEEIYLDQDTGRPEWAAYPHGHLSERSLSFAPLRRGAHLGRRRRA